MPTTTGLATSFITFSRPGASGGGATVTDRDGKIKWAGHNLLTNSESFDASSWTKTLATITPNAIAAPNGTTTADKFLSTNTNTGEMYQNISKEASAITYTTGVFAKAGGFNWLQIAVYDAASTGSRFWFNLSTGAKGSTAAIGSGYTNTDYNIVSIGDGWYYCWVKATTNTGTTNRILFYPANADNTFTAGNGTDGVHLWGAHSFRSDLGGMQLNPAMPAGMQSYYPTTPRNLLGSTEAVGSWGLLQEVQTSANVAVAPNGLQTADKVSVNNGTTASSTYAGQAVTQIVNTPYTYSIYVKKAETRYATIAFWYSPTNYAGMQFDFDTQTVTRSAAAGTTYAVTTADFTSIGNGWYRLRLLGTVGQTNGAIAVIGTNTAWASGAPIVIQTGNGSDGVFVWGAQLSDSASLDTYVPVYGAAVTSAAYYAPRLDFDPVTLAAKGLLVEELRTNLAVYNMDFSRSVWFKLSCTASAHNVSDPNGTNTASTITATTNAAYFYLDIANNPTGSVTATASVWIRRRTGTGAIYLRSDVATGNDTEIPVTSTWQRVQMQVTPSPSVASGNCWVLRLATAGDAVDLWMPQLEVGSFMTSVIPTGSATATRAADVASVSTQAFPYSDTAGTVVVNVDMVGASASTANGFFNISDGTPTSLTGASWITAYGDTSVVYSGRRSNNTSATNISSSQSLALNTPFKVGLAYAVGGTDSMTVNGGTIASQSGVASAYTNSILRLGTFLPGGNPGNLNGHIRQITYLPRRISNAELQSRSA